MKTLIWFAASAVMLTMALLMGHLWSSSHDLGEAASASIFGLAGLAFVGIGLKAIGQDDRSA